MEVYVNDTPGTWNLSVMETSIPEPTLFLGRSQANRWPELGSGLDLVIP